MNPITIALLVAIGVVVWRVRGRLSLGEYALMMLVGVLFASTTMGVTVHHAATTMIGALADAFDDITSHL